MFLGARARMLGGLIAGAGQPPIGRPIDPCAIALRAGALMPRSVGPVPDLKRGRLSRASRFAPGVEKMHYTSVVFPVEVKP